MRVTEIPGDPQMSQESLDTFGSYQLALLKRGIIFLCFICFRLKCFSFQIVGREFPN